MILVLFYETSEGVQQSQKCLLFNEGSHAKFLECPYYMLSKLSLRLGDVSQALEGSDQSQARIPECLSAEVGLGILTSNWSEPWRRRTVPGVQPPIRGYALTRRSRNSTAEISLDISLSC